MILSHTLQRNFFKNSYGEKVTMYGVSVSITKDFLVEITGLPNMGIKFKKEMSISISINKIIKTFERTLILLTKKRGALLVLR